VAPRTELDAVANTSLPLPGIESRSSSPKSSDYIDEHTPAPPHLYRTLSWQRFLLSFSAIIVMGLTPSSLSGRGVRVSAGSPSTASSFPPLDWGARQASVVLSQPAWNRQVSRAVYDALDYDGDDDNGHR
jgi:hypothetical protein